MARTPGNPLLAILFAIVIAMGIVYLVETLSHQMMPYAAALDPGNPAQLKSALEAGELPVLGMALILGGWLLGAYAGGRVAATIGREEWVVMTFAGLFTALVVTNLLAMPSPTWMWVGGAGGCPLFAIGAAGSQLSVRV